MVDLSQVSQGVYDSALPTLISEAQASIATAQAKVNASKLALSKMLAANNGKAPLGMSAPHYNNRTVQLRGEQAELDAAKKALSALQSRQSIVMRANAAAKAKAQADAASASASASAARGAQAAAAQEAKIKAETAAKIAANNAARAAAEKAQADKAAADAKTAKEHAAMRARYQEKQRMNDPDYARAKAVAVVPASVSPAIALTAQAPAPVPASPAVALTVQPQSFAPSDPAISLTRTSPVPQAFVPTPIAPSGSDQISLTSSDLPKAGSDNTLLYGGAAVVLLAILLGR